MSVNAHENFFTKIRGHSRIFAFTKIFTKIRGHSRLQKIFSNSQIFSFTKIIASILVDTNIPSLYCHLLPICFRYASDIIPTVYIGSISESYRRHIGIISESWRSICGQRRRKIGRFLGAIWEVSEGK